MPHNLACPHCGAEIRYQRNPWTPWRGDEPFRCQTCATMLKLKIPVISTIFVGVFVPLEASIFIFGDLIFGSGWTVQILKFALSLVILAAFVWITRNYCVCQLVVHSDE